MEEVHIYRCRCSIQLLEVIMVKYDLLDTALFLKQIWNSNDANIVLSTCRMKCGIDYIMGLDKKLTFDTLTTNYTK